MSGISTEHLATQIRDLATAQTATAIRVNDSIQDLRSELQVSRTESALAQKDVAVNLATINTNMKQARWFADRFWTTCMTAAAAFVSIVFFAGVGWNSLSTLQEESRTRDSQIAKMLATIGTLENAVRQTSHQEAVDSPPPGRHSVGALPPDQPAPVDPSNDRPPPPPAPKGKSGP
jgi:hypothetical protein